MVKIFSKYGLLITLFISFNSCSYFFYQSPEHGATISVNSKGCSLDYYVNGEPTTSNIFKIPINVESKIKVKAKHYISNGYYYDYTYYTLEPSNSNSSAEIEIEYKGDGKFGSSINVKGMSVIFN